MDDLDLFDVQRDLLLRLRGRGCGLEDGERGFEADAGTRVGIGEDLLDGLDGEVGQGLGFFPVEQGTVVLSVGEGVLERERVAAPVADGIAVNAGLFRGFGGRRAAGQGADDGELLNHFLA